MVQRAGVLAVLAAVALAACGGEEDGNGEGAGGTGGPEAPVCEDTPLPCGGSPVGVWTYDQSCGSRTSTMHLSSTKEACRNLPATLRFVLAGELRFGADGTFAETSQTEQHLVFYPPVACLEAVSSAPPAEFCVEVGRQIVEQNDAATGGCAFGEDQLCRCEVIQTGPVEQDTTWTAEGETLSVEGDASYEFCVQGDYLVRWREAGLQKLTHVLVRTE